MKKIAIIPARSGSRGLRNKNILCLYGKPMIAWTIEAAINSNEFSRVIVSTDSLEYKKISENYGAEVIIRRDDLACDSATTYDVVRDLFEDKIKDDFDYFVLLQPTSPLRTYVHIKKACEIFENNILDYDFLVSVKKSSVSKELINPLGENNSLEYFDTDFSRYRRQSNQNYEPNGAIFLGKRNEYLKHRHFFGKKSLAYIMDETSSVDIDTKMDFEFALVLMSKMVFFAEGQTKGCIRNK